jgi:predicted CoA-binding protein
MTADQLKHILESAQTIAVVGLSASPEKKSHEIAAYLKSQGYRVIPVNPSAAEILGEKSYPDLTAVPDKVDVVQLFRPSEDVPPFVDQAIQIGAKAVWMQEGIVNEAAAATARAAGLEVVMDRCMRVEHRRLIGEKTT